MKTKRTLVIIIVPMFSLSVMLTGCNSTNSQIISRMYVSSSACMADGVYTHYFCRTQFNQARSWHNNHAPKYSNLEECERIYGRENCESNQQGTSVVYRPSFRGYSLGSNNETAYSEPIYGSNNSGYRAADGSYLGKTTGREPLTTPKSSTTTSRGIKTKPRGIAVKRSFGFGGIRGSGSVRGAGSGRGGKGSGS